MKKLLLFFVLIAYATFTANADLYLRHPWGGKDWAWKQLTDKGDNVYQLIDQYGGAGCNVNDHADGGGYEKWIEYPNLYFSPNIGDKCVFSFLSENGTIGNLSIIAIERNNFFLKHDWGNKAWSWKKLRYNSGNMWSVVSVYGGSGVNCNTNPDDNGNLWIPEPKVDGEITKGDVCMFTYDNNNASVTISKLTTPKVFIIVDGNETELKYSEDGNGSYYAAQAQTFAKDSEHEISFKMTVGSETVYLNPVSNEDASKELLKNKSKLYVEENAQNSYTFVSPSDNPCNFAVSLRDNVVLISTDIVTAVEDVEVAGKAVKAYKVIENGQVVIVRGEQRFNIMGQPIR